MSARQLYIAQCREEAEELGSWAARYYGDHPSRGHFARLAARAAFVVLGLRYNKAESEPVEVAP